MRDEHSKRVELYARQARGITTTFSWRRRCTIIETISYFISSTGDRSAISRRVGRQRRPMDQLLTGPLSCSTAPSQPNRCQTRIPVSTHLELVSITMYILRCDPPESRRSPSSHSFRSTRSSLPTDLHHYITLATANPRPPRPPQEKTRSYVGNSTAGWAQQSLVTCPAPKGQASGGAPISRCNTASTSTSRPALGRPRIFHRRHPSQGESFLSSH